MWVRIVGSIPRNSNPRVVRNQEDRDSVCKHAFRRIEA